MTHTRSSYSGSPTRQGSAMQSPTRPESITEEGSQYEIDLEALGLNSTFDSSQIDGVNAPKVDTVDESDIGGPEDFTMNMTYWMTADLPLSHVKSRKEAHTRVSELRGDMRQDTDAQDITGEGDNAIIEDTARDRVVSENTVRDDHVGQRRHISRARSTASLENDEKVMSYLSALPDTEMPDAITSTPLKLKKATMLQVPSPAISRARSKRSLQATVEDYDTPRKPTQETVIHHPLPTLPTTAPQDDTEESGQMDYDVQEQIAEQQERFDQQELAFRTRITELETILSYTRAELDTARNAAFTQKEEIVRLKSEDERRKHDQESGSRDFAAQLKEKERELSIRMEEFGEELRLQNLAKLQNQREEFEKKLQESEEAKKVVEEQMEDKEQTLAQMRCELDEMRQSEVREIEKAQRIKQQRQEQRQQQEQEIAKEREALNERLSSLQTQAESLQSALEKATSDAKTAREEAEAAREDSRAAQQEAKAAQEETHTLREEARATPPSQQSTLQGTPQIDEDRIAELESLNRSLQSQLESLRADLASKDKQLLRTIEDQDRLDQRLSAASGRNEGLATTISTLRQQLADAHRESAKARTDVERLEQDLESWSERLEDARKEADRRVTDVEKKLTKMKESKAEAETRFKDLQSEHVTLIEEHDAELDEVRDKAEDAVRKVGSMLEAERSEKRRLVKELKRSNDQLDKLRVEIAKKAAEDFDDSEDETSMTSTQSDSKEVEIANLRTLVKTQSTTIKTFKSEISSLKKKAQTSSTLQCELEALRTENSALRSTIETLKRDAESQRADYEAINKTMDERLAAMLSKFLKDRSKAISNKRDDQWAENVGKLKGDKELMGKVLMREWGKQECGVDEEKQKQRYRYQYVKRSTT